MASRRGRRRRNQTVADSKLPPELGAEQLPQNVVSGEAPEAPDPDDEPDGTGRPDRGGEGRDVHQAAAEEGVEGLLRDVPADEAGGETEERLGHWPYRIVRTAEDLLALGEWLQVLGSEVDKTLVGVSANSMEMAFATKSQGWLVPRRWQDLLIGYSATDTTVRSLVQSVLGKALTSERASPALICRQTELLMAQLEPWLGQGYNRNGLVPNIVHDMAVLEYATGRPVAKDLSPLKDALDCATVGPGQALDAPRFYREVGIPLAQFNAHSLSMAIDKRREDAEGKRWTLTYDWLLFRVLTHYTRDPTLTRWFQDSSNPLDMFMRAVDLEPNEAIAFLLWMVCGEKEEMVGQYYPDWATHLPEAPQMVKAARVDKNLPSLRLGLIRLVEQYTMTRRAETLYGRRSPWGLQPHELLHFAIMGSVNDLLDVTMASILNAGSDTHWLQSAQASNYDHWLRATIVGYTQRDSMEWARDLETLGGLSQPLGTVELEPRVSVE